MSPSSQSDIAVGIGAVPQGDQRGLVDIDVLRDGRVLVTAPGQMLVLDPAGARRLAEFLIEAAR